MKIAKSILLVAIAIIAVVLIVKNFHGTSPVAVNNPPNIEKLCYIWNTEAGDKGTLSIDVKNSDVAGEFYFSPFEKDTKQGPFTGTITGSGTNRTVNAIWDTMAEGMSAQEELRIIIDGSIAKPGFGEMKDRGDGVYVYANPDAISYSISLQQTDCSSFVSGVTTTTGTSNPVSPVVTLTGTSVCLPHKDTSGPQTLECASGLKISSGLYYGLDTSTVTGLDIPIGSQTQVTVTGTLTPVEALNTDFWNKYNIEGIIKVTSVKQ